MSIFFLFVLFTSSDASELNSKSNFKNYHLKYSYSGDTQSKDVISIDWDLNQKKCQIKMPKKISWTNFSLLNCEQLEKFLAANSVSVSEILKHPHNARARKMRVSLHLKLSEIELEGKQIGTKRNLAEWCDEKMEHCKLEEHNSIDDLSEMIRKMVLDQNSE